jgi:hypothetical protein
MWTPALAERENSPLWGGVTKKPQEHLELAYAGAYLLLEKGV